MAFLDGTMELMRPCKQHERHKSFIGRLAGAFALERGIDFSPYGSWTLCDPDKAVAVEPDECFLFGEDQDRDRPDLAIEVVWTSGGIDKPEVYRRLGVPELWFWRAGAIEVHVLADGRYRPSRASPHLSGLDIELVGSLLDRNTLTEAILAFRAALQG